MLTLSTYGLTVNEELPKRVLLILRHEQQRRTIESALSGAGFEVSVAADHKEALRVMSDNKPAVIIVDRALPGIADMLLCMRTDMDTSETRIISLSEPQFGPEITPAPDIGADVDFQRPVIIEELLTKIAELQSQPPATSDQRVLTAGAIRMIPDKWLVYANGESINLTEKEFRLLWELMEVKGRVLTREALMRRVWGHEQSFDLETRTLDVHMSRLRAKLKSSGSNIITVRNVGYRMNVAPEWLNQ